MTKELTIGSPYRSLTDQENIDTPMTRLEIRTRRTGVDNWDSHLYPDTASFNNMLHAMIRSPNTETRYK